VQRNKSAGKKTQKPVWLVSVQTARGRHSSVSTQAEAEGGLDSTEEFCSKVRYPQTSTPKKKNPSGTARPSRLAIWEAQELRTLTRVLDKNAFI